MSPAACEQRRKPAEQCDEVAATTDALTAVGGIFGFVVGAVVGYQILRGMTAADQQRYPGQGQIDSSV